MSVELMTIEEVAEFTRLPLSTLRYYRMQGMGPKSAKLGKRVMYRRAEVEAWVNSHFDGAPS